jgi:hypothetical protein
MFPRSLFTLPASHTLTVTPVHGAIRVVRMDGGLAANITVATVYGPYAVAREFEVVGQCTGVIAESDGLTAINAAVDIIEAIPATDQDDSATVWNDAGVLKVSTAP